MGIRQAVNETLHDTWFRLPQEDEVVVTHTGSRPGDSLSDLVFSFLFSKVLKQVRESLREAGAIAQIPWAASMTNNIDALECAPDSWIGVTDATWMDDLVMFLTHPDAPSLIRNLKLGASTLLDSCLQRALLPNLTRGKTEAIVHACGPGARKIRSDIFGPGGGSIGLTCRLWDNARLRVVPIYRHLGGYLQHNGGLKQEISFRTSQAWDAFNKRKKKLFQSPLVSDRDKAVFFTSLISTVLFHGLADLAHGPRSQSNTLESIDATLRQMACQMLRPHVSIDEAWHLGTAQVLARAGVPRASTYLHVARLRHILACFQLPVPEIWALAHWERHWLSAVRDSIRWMWKFLDGGRHHGTWRAAWDEWRTDCSNHPGRWKSKIRRALRNALHQERWQAAVEQHWGLLSRQLRLGGAVLPRVSQPITAIREVCALCNVIFGDFRAWSVHAFSCHGRIDEVRSLAAGLQCQHCLRHFATNVRLCRHLRHSAACRRTLLGTGRRIVPVPGIGSRKAPKEHLFCAPTLQAAGPQPLARGDWIDDELDRPAAEVLDCLAHIDFDGIGHDFDPDVVWTRIRQAFSCICLPAKRLHVTACVWYEHLSQLTHAPNAGSPLYTFLLHAARWVQNADFAEWLAPDPTERPNTISTFRDSGDSLGLLDFSGFRLPPLQPWTKDHVLVCVGQWPPTGLDTRGVPEPLIYAQTATLAALADGRELDFFAEAPTEVGFFLNTCGLPVPTIDYLGTAPHFEDSLSALSLSCDLVRFALKLWISGICACLHVPWPCGVDISSLIKIEGVRFLEGIDRATLWVGSPDQPLTLFHTS